MEVEEPVSLNSFAIIQNEFFIANDLDAYLKSCCEDDSVDPTPLLIPRDSVKGITLDQEAKNLLKEDIKSHLLLVKEVKEIILRLRIKLGELIESSSEVSYSASISFIKIRIEALMDLSRYLALLALMKVNGDSIEGHPIIAKIVFLKTFLTKLKPMNKKLEYQIGKMIRKAVKNDLDARNVYNEEEEDESDEGDSQVSQQDDDYEKDDGDNFQELNDPKKLRYLTANFDAEASAGRVGGKVKRDKRFEEYRKNRLLESDFVRGMEQELEERPRELVAYISNQVY